MLRINKKWQWCFAVLALLLAVNVQASSLCANGKENSATLATTPNTDFSDNGDGTVTHHKTGLIWQRCSLGQSWDGTGCSDTANTYTWRQALQQAEQNSFAGVSDWRLPNKNELASIIEYSCVDPAINSQLFPNTPAYLYWSSSPRTSHFTSVWHVDFSYGYVSSRNKAYSHHVRLVRAGQ